MLIPPQIAVPLGITRAHWKLVVLGVLLLAIAVQTIRLGSAERRADRLQFTVNECREGRKEDRAAYKEAQRVAGERNKAEVSRIKSEQEKVSHEVQSDLNARLERLRRELQQKTAAAGSAAGRPATGPDGRSRPGAVEAPRLCLAPDELLRGAENEERHDQLITWVERQLGVKR